MLTASERGASHEAAQTPNQDAVATQPTGDGGVVAAVADGHGHWRHLRSARGSRIAATIGCEVGQELADRLEREKILHAEQDAEGSGPLGSGPSRSGPSVSGPSGSGVSPGDGAPGDGAPGDGAPSAVAPGDAVSSRANVIRALVSDFAVPAVIERWRAAVLADLDADPFTDAEQDQRQRGDDPTVAYGSTLLLAIALGSWLILAQIGDGDVVGVRPDGSASLPVPTDPLLDGMVTTSLCGRDPSADFRVAVTDTSADPLLALMLATDGYGNAQLVEGWPNAFSSDLAWLLRHRDEQWLASQLPAWAARCASADGSADDTTVALLISPAGAAELAPVPRGAPTTPVVRDDLLGSDETTIPAVLSGDTAPHDNTVPSEQVPPGLHATEPITTRMPNAGVETVQLDSPAGAESL